MTLSRRAFLSSSVTAGAAFGGLAALQRCTTEWHDPSYGPLVRAGDALALPRGFQYRVLGRAGAPMTDGVPTPPRHDGMAAFAAPNGNVVLVRNHEVYDHDARFGPAETAYDVTGGGGTTTLEVDPRTRELVRDGVSLNGTIVNCAGGPTPWGTWLTCEEWCEGTEQGWERNHGYVFEVPGGGGREQAAPLTAMGRFRHEAVALDPATGVVYLTEDVNPVAGFYRFLPAEPGRLAAGGTLEMLAIAGRPGYDTRRGQMPAQRLGAAWVPIPDPDPADVSRNFTAVQDQGLGGGAALFAPLEGCWWGDGAVYFDATNGGDAELGQIWRYDPAAKTLGLIFESRDRAMLANPDNLCWSPRGGLVVCEDTRGTCRLRGVTPAGRLFEFARNIADGSEFAGATFSPDGRTLFVNAQDAGMTFAIWGPWERGSL